ncbi:MAG: metallophosphoesterase [Verrucomicrobiales bacterium]
MPFESRFPPSRRAMLRRGALLLGGAPAASSLLAEESRPPALRFGAVTDIHYADKPPNGSRHYRESLDKLARALERLEPEEPAFVVELGDFIDRTESVEEEIEFLRKIEGVFAKAPCDRHYVLGNHCVDTLTKEEFLENSGATAPHYSFDRGDFHFVVLDSCFRSDGEPYGRNNHEWTDPNLPEAQLQWLAEDLQKADRPAIVFAHQRLDGEGAHYVNNAAAVRGVMAESGKVLAVLQGHSHRNEYRELDSMHFCTLVAVVEGSGPENNGCSLVSLFEDGSIRIDGFLRQKDYDFTLAG